MRTGSLELGGSKACFNLADSQFGHYSVISRAWWDLFPANSGAGLGTGYRVIRPSDPLPRVEFRVVELQ